MIDWHKKAGQVGRVGVVIDGEEVSASAVPAAVFRMITLAHPEPGVPTDENGEKVWQDDTYRARLARHRQDMIVLEAAAMLGFADKAGRTIRRESSIEDARAWVADAICVFGMAMSYVDCHTVVMMVHAATGRIGAEAKNSSSSSPSRSGSTVSRPDSRADAPSST